MNIVFYLVVALALAALWFLLSFTFPTIGKFFLRIFNDTKENITGESEDKK